MNPARGSAGAPVDLGYPWNIHGVCLDIQVYPWGILGVAQVSLQILRLVVAEYEHRGVERGLVQVVPRLGGRMFTVFTVLFAVCFTVLLYNTVKLVNNTVKNSETHSNNSGKHSEKQ